MAFFAGIRSLYSLTLTERPENQSLFTYKGQSKLPKQVRRVKIASNVTRIPSRAFYKHGRLELVDFSDAINLETIGEEAFCGCIHVTEVKLPASLKIIETRAFYCCNSLKEIRFNANLEEIGDMAFEKCRILEHMDLTRAKHLEIIGSNAFRYCNFLKTVTLPRNIKVMRSGVFRYCYQLREIHLNGKIEEIPEWAFANCESLRTVDFGEARRLQVIGEGAFARCIALQAITIPPGIKVIGRNSFSACPLLRELCLNQQLEKIDSDAFVDCNDLRRVVLPASIQYFDTAFDKRYMESVEIHGNNLPLAIRLIGMYPDSCRSISKDWMMFQYSFHRIQSSDLILPEYTGDVNAWKEEQDAVKEIELEFVEATRQLLLWCVARGMLR
jgi:hypothetical protein